jgi:hypothetical protein
MLCSSSSCLSVLAEKYLVNSLLALCVEKYLSRLQSLCDPIEFFESIPKVYALPLTSIRTLKDVAALFAHRDGLCPTSHRVLKIIHQHYLITRNLKIPMD